MNDYVRVDLEEVKESIDFPTTEDLKPSEFMAWHKAQDSLNGNKPMSSLLQSWNAGHQLVRAWPEGVDPKDYELTDPARLQERLLAGNVTGNDVVLLHDTAQATAAGLGAFLRSTSHREGT